MAMARTSSAKTQTAPSGIGRRRAAARNEGGAAYQQKLAEIKSAAGDLFKREGFRGASIGRLAQALDMERATLYYYVGSKEQLFDDVVSGAVRENAAYARRIKDGAGSAPQKLRTLITALMQSYSDNYPLLYVFIQENLSHVGEARSEWSQEMRALNKSYEDVIIDVIQGGLDDGSLRPVAEAWVIAYGVIGMIGWTNRWFNPDRTPIDAATIGAAYADILLAGLQTGRRPPVTRLPSGPAAKAVPGKKALTAKKAVSAIKKPTPAKETPAAKNVPAAAKAPSR